MLQALLRAGLFYAIWRQLKPRLKGLVVAAVALLIINIVHAEALRFFAETGQSAFVPRAFYFKWFGWIVVATYLIVEEMRVERRQRKHSTASASSGSSIPKGDGYDEIRPAERLRPRSEQILEKKRNANKHTD